MRIAILLVAVLGLAVFAINTSPAYAAVDMFMKIQGIPGESTDSKHPGEIEVLSWSWGASNPGSASAGTSGKVQVQDFHFTKFTDKATTGLLESTFSGKHIPKAEFFVRKAGGTQLEFLKITMEDIIVSNMQMGGSGGDDKPIEQVSLNFAKITIEYTPQKADGSADTTGKTRFGWDLKANTKI